VNHSRSRHTAAVSVQRDWIGWLPECKQEAFDRHARELEARYLMLSVTLDEAIGLHNHGPAFKAIQNISLVPALCGRLTRYLESTLSSLEAQVKCNALIPNVASPDPQHFLRSHDKYLARKCSLLSRIVLTRRSGFLFKINMLREMVFYLGDDCCASAGELSSGAATTAYSKQWVDLDTGHFDLNTCLRESLVMLRCFLRVLPENRLAGFEKTMALQLAAPATPRVAPRIVSAVPETTTRG
jgi:hypothetical protein